MWGEKELEVILGKEKIPLEKSVNSGCVEYTVRIMDARQGEKHFSISCGEYET